MLQKYEGWEGEKDYFPQYPVLWQEWECLVAMVSWWENLCNLQEKTVAILCVNTIEKFLSKYEQPEREGNHEESEKLF